MKCFFFLFSFLVANVAFAHEMQLYTDDHTHANKGQRSEIPVAVMYDDREISLNPEENIGWVVVIVKDFGGVIIHAATVFLTGGSTERLVLEPDKNDDKYSLEIHKGYTRHYGFF